MKCKKCGTAMRENAKFCFECGEKVIKELKCKKCGSILMPNSKFCDECGTKVEASADNSVAEKDEQQISSMELMKYQGFVEYKGSIYYAVNADESNYYKIIKFDIANEEKTIVIKGYHYNANAGYGCTSESLFNIMDDYIYYQNYVEGLEDSKFDYIVSKIKVDGTNKRDCIKVDKKDFDSDRFIVAFHGNIIYELYKENDTRDNWTYGYYLYNCSTQTSKKFSSEGGEIIGASNTEFIWNSKSECLSIDFVNDKKYKIEDKYKNIKRDELLFVDCYKNIAYCTVNNKYSSQLNLNSNPFNLDFEKILGINTNGEIVNEWIINDDLKHNNCNVLWICFDGNSLVALVDINGDRKCQIIVCEKDGSYKEIYNKESLAGGKIHLHDGYVYFMESKNQENLISRIKIDGSGYLSNIEKFR